MAILPVMLVAAVERCLELLAVRSNCLNAVVISIMLNDAHVVAAAATAAVVSTTAATGAACICGCAHHLGLSLGPSVCHN